MIQKKIEPIPMVEPVSVNVEQVTKTVTSSDDNGIAIASPKGAGQSQDVVVSKQDVLALPPAKQAGGASIGNAPILQELNNLPEQEKQVNSEVFVEVPEEYCGQLYSTGLEIIWSVKNKGLPIRELPEKRVKEQGHIIYEIMKKNQISFAHIDLFMLGAGMLGDWKYLDSYAQEQRAEETKAGEKA